MNDIAFNALRPSELTRALLLNLELGFTPFVWGSPGIGKSDLCRALALATGRPMIDIRVSQLDAVDSRGVPFVENGVTKWAVPEIFPRDPNANHIIFLDEFNSGKDSVMAAMYQLILDRRLGDYIVPENVWIIGAGNLETDRAIVNKMGTALEGRFVHFVMLVDLDDWTEWALDHDIDSNVLVYLRNISPDSLHRWSPKSATRGQPTPRTWARVSKVVQADPTLNDRRVIQASIAGLIGDGETASFMGFLDVAAKMPDPDECIANPDGAEVPTDPTVLYALCGAIAHRANLQNIDGAYRYADRLDPEFTALLVTDSARRTPKLRATKGYMAWSVKNGKAQTA